MSDFQISECLFQDVNFKCDFFSSLKEDYSEFLDWTKKKAREQCFIAKKNDIIGFLYLKIENEELKLQPILPAKKRVKIGTFKIIPHGTKLGERFLKKVFDIAMGNKVQEIYVTVFPKHKDLIDMFKNYGFKKEASKKTSNGVEDVYVKDLDSKISISEPTLNAYPRVQLGASPRFYLLSIYPKYHTLLFPDSKLKTERFHLVSDVSYTNSIHKVYVTKMQLVNDFRKDDVLIIYRTAESGKIAEYNSVATSICVIESKTNIYDYSTESQFVEDISKYSVFEKSDLSKFYRTKAYPYVIKMLYNIALTKRITRHDLIEEIGLDRDLYWGCLSLKEEQFRKILSIGMEGNYENYIID